MKKLFLILIIASGLLSNVSLVSCNTSATKASKEEKITYQCSMGCENGKTYDKPGQCPVCNMDLEQVGEKSQ